MPANVEVDGIKCRIEKLKDATICVRYDSQQCNPVQGPGTGGEMMYIVHPCQRNQYERLNSSLPSSEQAMPSDFQADQRPWWSLPAGERANLRE